MPKDTREPQSYGSNADWVTGQTGQDVQDPKAPPPAEHREFYDSRRESETSAPDQGGKLSGVDRDAGSGPHTAPDAANDETTPVQKVTAKDGGAKRDSYFKKRDYE
jgi:hypothetical protein